jgi:aminoglycoside phosphotransferase (APT) family kinase protein
MTTNPHDILAQAFPDLADRPVTVVQAGLDSHVLDVDGEWIVRIARRANIETHYKAEVALLGELAHTVSLPVPRPELCPRHSGVMRYRRLRGTTLEQHADGAHSRALGAQLGAFLGELHRFPKARVKEAGVRAYDRGGWLEQVSFAYAEARDHAFPLLEPCEREAAKEMFESFLASGFEISFTLMHGDLKPEHILCDRAKGLISGVIDWTDARIGDPAVDFAWILHGAGAAFAGAASDAYRSADQGVVERSRFYYRLEPLFSLIFGAKERRPDLVGSSLAVVRERLSA